MNISKIQITFAVTTTILFFFVSTSLASAMCVWGIVPPQKIYKPVDATEAFLSYENGVQTLVLKPEFRGNARDFAIIYPTPSRPEITEGPKDLFRELDDVTNPAQIFFLNAAAKTTLESTADSAPVTVIEQKNVGNYTSTILTATSANELINWLRRNNYSFTIKDTDKINYYVSQGGYYFIALKVNLEKLAEQNAKKIAFPHTEEAQETSVLHDPEFLGETDPVQISFTTDKPQLPMRTMKGDIARMVFDLYTLSDAPLYVPGVDTVWSGVVDNRFLDQTPSLESYNPRGKWLLRQEIRFSPQRSDEDLFLSTGSANNFKTAQSTTQVRFNPSLLNPRTGVIPGTRGEVFNTISRGGYIFSQNLGIGSVGEEVRQLQIRLNAEGFAIAQTGFGSPGNETTYFGTRTQTALIKYQNFYRNQITPIGKVRFQLGFLDTPTRQHMNGINEDIQKTVQERELEKGREVFRNDVNARIQFENCINVFAHAPFYREDWCIETVTMFFNPRNTLPPTPLLP